MVRGSETPQHLSQGQVNVRGGGWGGAWLTMTQKQLPLGCGAHKVRWNS